jgi:hypothetical protein
MLGRKNSRNNKTGNKKAGKKKVRASKDKKFSLPQAQRKVLEYWHASIKQGQRHSVSLRDNDIKVFETDFASIGVGNIDINRFSTFIKDAAKGNRRGATGFNNDGEIGVLVCPLVYCRKGSKKDSDRYGPLWVPATLNKHGILNAPRDALPWIPREHLEPVTGNTPFILGDLEDSDGFFLENQIPDSKEWSTYWPFCQSLFKSVTECSVATHEIEGFYRTSYSLIVLDEAVRGAYVHIERHYDRLLEAKVDYRLFEKLADPKIAKRKVYKRSRRDAGRAACKHVAHVNKAFPLSFSQRLALHRVLSSESGDILCVSGPPGTGKTTLIQSVVASFWVEGAMQGAAYPPVVLACGETNQSVTNIIDSFALNDSTESRWLPEVDSFGTYCCSEQRAKMNPGVQFELSSGEGFSREREGLDFLEKAQARYLKCAAKALGKKTNLGNVIRILRKELNGELAKLRHDIRAIPAGNFFTAISENNGRGDYGLFREYYRALARYDTNRRHKAFQLATHYWEGRWLLELREELNRRASNKDLEARFRNSPRDWRRRAMLTPIFVSTFSMAPRFFHPNRDSSRLEQIDSAPVDMLIVDEAGKSTPETAAPAFSFADRALVVGDREQLEPIWNVQRHEDLEALEKYGLLSMCDEEELLKRGLMASAGDLMTLALGACTGIEESRSNSTIGGFLSEHRRSVPEIISYCNRLCYSGRLIPKRAEIKKRRFPALGYYHVRGEGEKVGSSRRNLAEANKIEEWLALNERLIATAYKTNRLDNHVAVITPFYSQARLLEQKLKRTYPELVIGTVGSLQGAEREIVIFSSVYDRGFKGEFFFDKSRNHLNVAVSRAKDSFLVFGDMTIFNPKSKTPSGELARALLKTDEQNLAKNEQPSSKKSQAKFQDDVVLKPPSPPKGSS